MTVSGNINTNIALNQWEGVQIMQQRLTSPPFHWNLAKQTGAKLSNRCQLITTGHNFEVIVYFRPTQGLKIEWLCK